jgi:hypothetical protein
MLEKPIDAIDEAVLISLVESQASERRDLEFKRDLPGQEPDNIREFLADVTSLANSSGGDLIFGIEDADGVAAGLPGVVIGNVDDEILRLEQIIRTNVDPRLIGVRTHYVPFAAGSGALVIRVPPGLQPPHRVTYRNSGKFYSRTSRGKYELDVHELRHAFVEANQLPVRFRQLHAEGIERARGLDMPFAIMDDPTAVISTIPLSLFRDEREIPITGDHALVPIKPNAYSSIDMMEGVMLHTPIKADTGRVRSFAITYRTGRTDVAWTIGGVRQNNQGQDMKLVFAPSFEEGLIDATRATQARLQQFGVEGPWVIYASVYGVRDHFMVLGDGYLTRTAFKDEALVGELRIDRIEVDRLLPFAKKFWLLFGAHRPDDMPFGAPNGA